MSRPIETPEPGADVRGRTIVWSAGSPVGVRPLGRQHPVVRRLGLIVLAAIAVFALAYAVHTWVVISPPPAGPVAPLWLPDQLPAGNGVEDAADDPRPSPEPTAAQKPDDTRTKAAPSPQARMAARGDEKVVRPASTSTGRRTSGSGSHHEGSGSSGSGHSGSGRSGGSDDATSTGHGNGGSGRGSDDGSSGHGSSGHGSSGHGSGRGSGHGSDDDSHGSKDGGGAHGS